MNIKQFCGSKGSQNFGSSFVNIFVIYLSISQTLYQVVDDTGRRPIVGGLIDVIIGAKHENNNFLYFCVENLKYLPVWNSLSVIILRVVLLLQVSYPLNSHFKLLCVQQNQLVFAFLAFSQIKRFIYIHLNPFLMLSDYES